MQDKVVYLTPEGKQRFTAELHELQTVRRHEVEEQIRRAKEFSDTVDNAEYDEAKTRAGICRGAYSGAGAVAGVGQSHRGADDQG